MVGVWACVAVLACVGALGNVEAANPRGTPNMIAILLDGVRWDYLSIHRRGEFPGFNKFIESGVKAEYLNPVYPPNSFPNWHTMVTGLYPESHGIVGNFIYDKERNSIFSLDQLDTTSDPIWWQDSEPLWITSTRAGLDTALFVWSRCDVAWEGSERPRYCTPYESLPPNTQLFVKHLNQAIDMIQQEGYSLAMVYDGVVDSQGHTYGPDSPEVAVAMRDVDLALLGLWEELDSRGMLNTTNVVVFSDHGMTNVGPGDATWLDLVPCLDPRKVVKVVEHGGYVNVQPQPGYAQQVEEALRTCPGVGEHVEVVRKEDMQERYHYKAHHRILEIMVIAKPGYYLKAPGNNISIPEYEHDLMGQHGFDQTAEEPEGVAVDMRGILFASGPSFAKEHVAGALQQVDVYPLLCRALALPCHAHNGSMDRIDDFFATFSSFASSTSSSPSSWNPLAHSASSPVVLFTIIGTIVMVGAVGQLFRS